MADRKAARKDESEAVGTTSDLIEEKVVAFAEQLGWLAGTVRARAQGWFDRKALSTEIGRIRDSAADLLGQLTGEDVLQRKTESKRTATSGSRSSRGPVDAPGKRHRKPPPQEPIDRRMGEPEGKKMGQKGAKTAGRRGVRR